VKQIRLLEGKGWLRVGSAERSRVTYSIGVWSTPDGDVFGKGYISGPVETIIRASSVQGTMPLELAEGHSIDVIVTQRNVGADWAEIYVSKPLPMTPLSVR
jgi:hypothetical protein